MTLDERLWYLKADLFNAILLFLIPRTYLRATTIWAMMRQMDTKISKREMEHYISEYKKWKEKDFQ